MPSKSFCIAVSLGLLAEYHNLFAQGSSFWNLDFESANVAGYSRGQQVPTSLAMPPWSALYGTSPSVTVGYDFVSLSIASISILDASAPAFPPLQGSYSALLEASGAGFPGGPEPVTISQSGLVPAGTRSLLVDMNWAFATPVVSIGGQVIPMFPVKNFATYTVYAGDISSFAGQTATLSFTEPPPATGSPSYVVLDNIVFSTTPVPEPKAFALFLACAFFASRAWRSPRKQGEP